MIEFKHWDITQRSKIEDIMGVIFKTPGQTKVGSLILRGILEDGKYSEERGKRQYGMYEEDMHKIFEASKVSKPTFFKVLKRLRQIGLINKDFSFYYLSMDFPNALRRLERAVHLVLEPKLKDAKMPENEV